MTSYILSTVHEGRRVDMDYWPGGNGTDYYGYVTSFSQFRDEMAEKCGVSDLEFYIVDSDGESKEITNSRELRDAVAHLDDREVLGVTAYSTGGGSEPEVWEDKASEEESDDDAESSDEEEEEDDDDRRLNAILKRFLSKAQKRSWVRYGLLWDEDVPSYPLYARNDYAVLDEVRHLQYVLTRLGYLPLNATSWQTGSYQGRTQEAVRRFREDYEIYGKDMTKYDRRTARKLGEVVRQYRDQGHLYI